MRFLSSVIDLVRSWWNVDRVRVSLDEGRLLRLDAGALLTIGGRTVEILKRRVRRRPAGAVITYDCRTPSGTARLLVRPPRAGLKPIVHWFEHGHLRRLDETDVCVWRTAKG